MPFGHGSPLRPAKREGRLSCTDAIPKPRALAPAPKVQRGKRLQTRQRLPGVPPQLGGKRIPAAIEIVGQPKIWSCTCPKHRQQGPKFALGAILEVGVIVQGPATASERLFEARFAVVPPGPLTGLE